MTQINVHAVWRFAVFVGLLWLSPGVQIAFAQTKVAIGYTVVDPSVLPLWIAHEQGILRKHDIDARVVVTTGTAVPRLLAGEFQFVFQGMPATILAALDGKDLKILAPSTTGRVSGQLVARPEIKQPADLRGKRFGVISIGAGVWIATMLALEHLGLNPQRDAISLKAVGNQLQMVQALKAGEVDAVVLDVARAVQLRTEGYAVLLDLYPANLYGAQNAITVTGTYAREHPDTVEKVLEAMVEAMAYSSSPANKDIVLRTLMKHMQITDGAAAERGYENFLRNLNRKPYPMVERLQNMQRIMALHEPKVLNLKADDLIDDRFIRKLDKSGVIDRLYSTYGVK